MIRAVVFDFDGTLTELTLDFPEMRESLDRFILHRLPVETAREYDGLLMLERILAIERRLGPRGPLFRSEAYALLRDLELKAADGKEVFPYTRQVLRRLREMSLRIGIMTRNCGAAVRKVFQELDEYTDVIVSREDTRLVKPDPSHPLTVVDRLGVSPSQAILVGDHPTDMAAGRAAGMRSVGVLSGRSSREELQQAGADHVISDIRGLLTIIRKLNDGSGGKNG